MSDLKTNLQSILNEKQQKIIPENIKKDVTIFNVTGTYEGSGGGSETTGIKQFATEEEMNSSTGNKEGDLAVVYSSTISNITADSQFQTAKVPSTVVLPEAVADAVEVRFQAVDSSQMFDCWGMLDNSNFMMSCYTESGPIRIEYTSSDGITYTRTDSGEETVDFGVVIQFSGTWNDAIGYFIQSSNNYFGGLYDFRNYLDKDYFRFIPINNIDFTSGTPVWNGNYTSEKYSVIDIQYMIRQMKNDGAISKTYPLYSFIDSDNDLIISEALPDRYIINSSGNLIGMGETTTSSYTYKLYKVDLDSYTYNLKNTKSKVGTLTISNNNRGAFDIMTKTIQVLIYVDYDEDIIKRYQDYAGFYLSDSLSGTATQTSMDFTGSYYDTYNKYQIAPTQLSADSDYVYEKEFYGKNGLEIGSLGDIISESFDDTALEIYTKAQMLYDKMTPVNSTLSISQILDNYANIYYIPKKSDGTLLINCTGTTLAAYFANCSKLLYLPLFDSSSITAMNSICWECVSLIEFPKYDTSNVTNMGDLCYNCKSLVTFPELTTTKVTTMSNAFTNCTSLSEESLNNILAMCANTTSAYTNTKTLKQIGLSETQATVCMGLSNYSAFTAAGWTTGY